MENICRICLRSPKLLLPLFDDTQLSEKIRVISSVIVEESDGFPNTACADCIINVNISYNFRLVVINSDVELKRRLTDNATETVEAIETDGEPLLRISEMIKVEQDDLDLRRSDGENERVMVEEREIKQEEEVHYEPKKRKYKCKKCDFVTEHFALYFKHDRRVHYKPQTRVCSICGKVIGISNFTKHLRIHDATPSKCDVCGKMCRNSESLRHHKFVHKGSKICEYCGKSFNYQSSYRVHVKKYHKGGLKKLFCNFCDKVFYQGNDLKRHMQKHTGERPHICEFCQKGFSSTNALKTHKRQHTNETPYVCELCAAAFKQRVSLRNHLSTKHPGSGITLN